jgi:hypothetical protein
MKANMNFKNDVLSASNELMNINAAFAASTETDSITDWLKGHLNTLFVSNYRHVMCEGAYNLE